MGNRQLGVTPTKKILFGVLRLGGHALYYLAEYLLKLGILSEGSPLLEGFLPTGIFHGDFVPGPLCEPGTPRKHLPEHVVVLDAFPQGL